MPHVPPLRQRGLALILVLWVITLMTIMAGSYALSTRREAALLTHAHERAKAVALADGGVHYAMLMLMLPNPKLRWRADGTEYVWGSEQARVRIRVYDEGGKVDLNAATPTTLRGLFNLLLHDDDKAMALADAIQDWRDPDDLKGMHGAEAPEYEAAGLKTLPQNRNFLVLEELRGVLGMTPELYRKLQPWLTLYSSQDGLNPAKASREVLSALLNGDQGALETYLMQRSQAQVGAPPPPPPPPPPGLKFHQVGDMSYTVEAASEFADQPGSGVRATIKRGRGMDGSPFTYLTWRARTTPPPKLGQEPNPAGE
ncbi:general secretion pathway protein K [Methylomagnum ishizawai]|uniref:General secretion pathway protein K n=1 Tax=Methylomagnum ishizawai TaxID=1760988 RepID=A0A1Y6DBE8_9GAMM|nr:type II secretion system protein GspK [Methylomagnum ishizawai]SMF96955.1 general secretion pathway protein K [Methylomagnum ishizawai]